MWHVEIYRTIQNVHLFWKNAKVRYSVNLTPGSLALLITLSPFVRRSRWESLINFFFSYSPVFLILLIFALYSVLFILALLHFFIVAFPLDVRFRLWLAQFFHLPVSPIFTSTFPLSTCQPPIIVHSIQLLMLPRIFLASTWTESYFLPLSFWHLVLNFFGRDHEHFSAGMRALRLSGCNCPAFRCLYLCRGSYKHIWAGTNIMKV